MNCLTIIEARLTEMPTLKKAFFIDITCTAEHIVDMSYIESR